VGSKLQGGQRTVTVEGHYKDSWSMTRVDRWTFRCNINFFI